MRRALALLAGVVAAAAVATPASAVVGGSPATPGSFPSLAFISDNVGDGETAYCTGTVVSPDVVLTAAHCLVDDTEAPEPPGGFSVTTGTLDPSQDPGQTYAASAVAIDPSFDPSVDSADAGVIVLATTTSAPPVTLADAADAAELAKPVGIVIAGWGLTSEDASAEPATLQTASMTTQTGFYCSQHGADLGFDESTEFCAPGAGTVAVCNGDSGGPAFAQGADGDQVELGMTDRSADCDPTQPSIFTSVDAVAAWVQGEIAANPPPSQVAAPASSGTPAAPAPAPAPAGTPTAAGSADPPRFAPLSGSYAGSSSQRRGRVELTFAAGSLSGARLEFNARCGGAWRGPIIRTRTWPAGAIKLLADAGGGWSLTAHYDAGGYRFVISGKLPASGGALGTLSATSAHPSCASGAVSWRASVVG